MHVDIHRVIRHGQVQHARRVFAGQYTLPARRFHRRGQNRRLHISPIDEERLVVSAAAPAFAHANEALQYQPCLMPVHLVHGAEHFAPVDAEHGGGQLAVARGVIERLALTDVAEGHVRAGQNQPHHQVGHIACLRDRLFEEFQAHWGVKKEVADDKRRAFGAGGFFDGLNRSAVVLHLDAALVCLRACCAGDMRHRCDGRQRFAAETQRLDAEQIIRAADFARRVALKRHADVLAADAAAVVRHAEIADAAVADFHRNRAGPRVQRVFHQFLDGGGRTLHHFACRDFANDLIGQELNLSCHLLPFLSVFPTFGRFL